MIKIPILPKYKGIINISKNIDLLILRRQRNFIAN